MRGADETWTDPSALEPWCPGPNEFPPIVLPFDSWALRCLRHGMFVSMFTISGPPYDAENRRARLALDFGVSGKWFRRGYGNDFPEAFRDAMSLYYDCGEMEYRK